MKTAHSKVTIHMVSSLDGYIAKKNNDVSWLQSSDHFEKGITLSDQQIEAFIKKIDCYVMGSKTYEMALELGWPYGNTPVIVITNRNLQTEKENIRFYSGNLEDLVNKKLKPKFENIWMVGGAMLTKAFINFKLANEIIVSIMPILLGGGTLFFDQVGIEQQLHLKDVKAYKDGMVELCYEILKD